ncbi:MAG: hypothetical protein GY754_28480 [bacterium]|nr:hypothetical protein [bacterium]
MYRRGALPGGATADNFGFSYWNRIPEALEDEGAEVYIASLPPIGSFEARATKLKKDLLEALAVSGKSKVNIVAHCLGGLDSRYMISNMDMGDKVASWTSISTTHRGSVIVDYLLEKLSDEGEQAFASCLDLVSYLLYPADTTAQMP